MCEFRRELEENILPFWINRMQDDDNGGFYGRIDGRNLLHSQANKGVVLNARILWTFSAAYRILKNNDYLLIANRVYNYLINKFFDSKNGGYYWELDCKGKIINSKKQTYAQGFVLYGLSEYYKITQSDKVLQQALDLFFMLEKYKDKKNGGYFEAFTESWEPIKDMRLSEKDANEKKSMNTHLHILEAYTNLLRIWENVDLKKAQTELINLFATKILDINTHHLHLFFTEDWRIKSSAISYGHDIEASWLLYEAADVLNKPFLRSKITNLSIKIADAAIEGLERDGSMIYEKKGLSIDRERHWWVQAEAVVGLMYAYKNSAKESYKNKSLKVWKYITQNIIDHIGGEWFWSIDNGKLPNINEDKAGFWKCPYHNGRMCLEMMNIGCNLEPKVK